MHDSNYSQDSPISHGTHFVALQITMASKHGRAASSTFSWRANNVYSDVVASKSKRNTVPLCNRTDVKEVWRHCKSAHLRYTEVPTQRHHVHVNFRISQVNAVWLRINVTFTSHAACTYVPRKSTGIRTRCSYCPTSAVELLQRWKALVSRSRDRERYQKQCRQQTWKWLE